MNDAWNPRHVLIVGAGPGIGSHVAHLASASGAAVTLVARKQSTLDDTRAQLIANDATSQVRTLVADAADPEGLAAVLAAYADNAQPPVDLALFNVSLWVPGGLDADLDEVTTGMQAGAVSALAMAQALAPTMKEAPAAAFAFTGGGSADAPMAASLALGMQKAAMRNAAFGLAKALDGTVIAVKTLTIRGTIAAGTAFDPAVIAASMWEWARDRGPEVERSFSA